MFIIILMIFSYYTASADIIVSIHVTKSTILFGLVTMPNAKKRQENCVNNWLSKVREFGHEGVFITDLMKLGDAHLSVSIFLFHENKGEAVKDQSGGDDNGHQGNFSK